MKTGRTDDLEIYWNLKEVLIKKNIKRPVDFQEMLKQYGRDLTYGAVYALVHEQPARVSMQTILAIVKMLGCKVDELIVIRDKGSKLPAAKITVPTKAPKVAKLDEHRGKITGPKRSYV